ncbi:hypothetical protein B0H11DRAFT_2309482, partial [Mycena galericulata]
GICRHVRILHVIRTRGVFKNSFLTIATVSLFILCTAHCALLFANMIFYDAIWEPLLIEPADEPTSTSIYNPINRAANTIYITSNVIADSIFIFRCYAIWNFRRAVIILPTILTVAVTVLGYMNVAESLQPITALPPDTVILPASPDTFFAFLFDISMAMSVLTTFILMGLSAGRIWWLARASQKLMGQRVTSRYYTVCAMVLESGALYCAGAVPFIYVAFASYTGSLGTDITTSGAILGQLVVRLHTIPRNSAS